QLIVPEPPSPNRRVLWAAALRLWAARPLLGIGPDVCRHVYGRQLGLQRFDERIHTNSLYLEVLTGTGAVGALAFATLLALVLWKGGKALLKRNVFEYEAQRLEEDAPDLDAGWWCLLATLLAVVAFLIHGVLDVFLAFTPTYLLFWLCVGMAAGLAQRQLSRTASAL
ncbi:MAG: hypothetical protein H7Y32_10500, partial [Chloroflexales bacterium]|nr:hypothetical protein [Chloroflexales bacterium]